MSDIRHRPLGPAPVDDDDFTDNESAPLTQDIYGGSQRTVHEIKGWDVFRDPPLKVDSGSMANQACLNISVKILKVFAYLFTFIIVLTGGVISKVCVLFMTSQLRRDRKIQYCNKDLGREKTFVTTLPEEERVAWMWALLIAFAIPEVGAWIRAARICFFKSWRKPFKSHFLFIFVMESLHTLGIALLMFVVLPELDAVKGAMLTNCLCTVPGILGLLSRTSKEGRRAVKAIVDLAAIAAQITGLVVWPLLENRPSLYVIPVAALMTSFGWWENYVCTQSSVGFVRAMGRVKEDLKVTRYFVCIFLSIWKLLLFFCAILMVLIVQGDDPANLFNLFNAGFGPHKIVIEEVTIALSQNLPDVVDAQLGDTVDIDADYNTVVYVLMIQIVAAYSCYIFGKFACKILIQGFSYAFPVNLTIPISISLLIAACGIRNGDPCFFHGTIPDYLFFESPTVFRLSDFAAREMAWAWLLWLLSQTWITLHIWTPKCERLATTEKLFVSPMYSGLLIDQSMALNRRRDDQADVKTEDLAEIEKEKGDEYYETISVNTEASNIPKSNIKNSDHITRIYACATMWHETKDEMIEFLKSIIRLDEDQCARRVAQKYLRVVDPDYYEFETHIFFDDAFEISDHNDADIQVNRFVKLLVATIDDAASDVHQTNIRVRPPKKYPTPYGGRLISKSSIDEDALINKKLPKELLLEIFSYLDVISLCRCAQVSKYWNCLAKDGTNWKTIDLFNWQKDISSEVVDNFALACKGFLKQLSLRGCKNISDTAFIIFSETCKNIEILNLNDCKKLTDVAIEKLGTICKKLINLNLSLCIEITDNALFSISRGCPRLKYLDVSYCTNLTDEGVRSIAENCKNLISFKAGMCNQLGDDSLIAIAENCTNLETLRVQGWIKLSDDSVHKIGEKCLELKYLCLSDCRQLNDYALISIGQNCTKLKVLEVTRCDRLTDNSFRVLAGNCHELTSLDLEECNQITDNSLSFLSFGCPLLEQLILSLCEQISDQGIRFITSTQSASQNLKVLELDNCPITDRSLDYLSQCNSLKRIEVYDCQGLSKTAIKEFMKANPDLKVHTYFGAANDPNDEPTNEPRTARDSRCCIIL